MLKELFEKVFGRPMRQLHTEPDDRASKLPESQPQELSWEHKSTAAYLAQSAGSNMSKHYIAEQLSQMSAYKDIEEQPPAALPQSANTAQPIPIFLADLSNAFTPESEKLPEAFKEISHARQRLLALAQSDNPDTRLTIAESTATTADILVLLASDREPDVRYAVACNPTSPESALFVLSRDENSYISHRALQTLKQISPADAGTISGEAFANKNKLTSCEKPVPTEAQVKCLGVGALRWLIRVAEDAKDPTILDHLSRHYHCEVRIAVADNPITPPQAISRLANDRNPDVRFALAENHQLSEEVLSILAEDSNPYVAHRAGRTLARIGKSSVLKKDFPQNFGGAWRTSFS